MLDLRYIKFFKIAIRNSSSTYNGQKRMGRLDFQKFSANFQLQDIQLFESRDQQSTSCNFQFRTLRPSARQKIYKSLRDHLAVPQRYIIIWVVWVLSISQRLREISNCQSFNGGLRTLADCRSDKQRVPIFTLKTKTTLQLSTGIASLLA